MEIKQLHDIFLSAPIVATDTRKIVPGSIFFALKGENFDANKFVCDALSKGASYAVADDAGLSELNDNRIIIVGNVLKTLQSLANYHRRTMDIPVLAITGTNGKTTTKELTTAALSQGHNVLATEGNLNNSIGVPLTLLKLKKEHTIAVVEMGASHPGDIEELVNIAEPNYGVITNVGLAHLQGFGSFEGVVDTKCELYNFISEKGGKLFVRNEDAVLMERSAKIDRVLYGESDGLTVKGTTLEVSPFIKVKLESKGGEAEVQTSLIGKYNLANIVAASAIALYFGVELSKIAEALSKYVPSNSRSQFIKGEHNNVILDAYNANPSSMSIAIENFKEMKADNKMLLLGDMLELGAESKAEHSKIAELIEQFGFTDVILVGKEFGSVNSKYRCFTTTNDLLEYLKTTKIESKTILVKGSRGIALEKALEHIV